MLTPAQIKKLRAAPLTGPNKVKLAMELAGVTQVQVAERLGTYQSRVSDVVRGEYSDLPLDSPAGARAWATLFGVLVEELFPAREDKQVAS